MLKYCAALLPKSFCLEVFSCVVRLLPSQHLSKLNFIVSNLFRFLCVLVKKVKLEYHSYENLITAFSKDTVRFDGVENERPSEGHDDLSSSVLFKETVEAEPPQM